MKIDLTPLSVGFDVRPLCLPVVIPQGITGILFEDANGNKMEAVGMRDEIIATLREHGYQIDASMSPWWERPCPKCGAPYTSLTCKEYGRVPGWRECSVCKWVGNIGEVDSGSQDEEEEEPDFSDDLPPDPDPTPDGKCCCCGKTDPEFDPDDEFYCPDCDSQCQCEPFDSMDGDHDSALASAGHGTDEDYGYYGEE